jgi:2-oxoglutarate/2-oxoacid ferredoxin oxidoreductase subunit alpha
LTPDIPEAQHLKVENGGMPPMLQSIVTLPLQAGPRYLSGNEAAAEGAIAAGCSFYAGYPITPSSEIMESLARDLPGAGGHFIQMEDELASISAVIGASWAGAKAMTATSGPGLSLMQECLGYAAFTETPLVVIDVQRAGPCTGQATKVGSGDLMAVKWGSHGDYQVIAFSPWSVEEMFTLTVEAFNWSERLRVPCFLLAEETIGHLRERVDFPAQVTLYQRDYRPGEPPFGTREKDGVPSMPRFGQGENLMITGSTHDERGFRRIESSEAHDKLVRRLNEKVLCRTGRICRYMEQHMESAELIVVAYGFTARAALKAVKSAQARGLPVGFLRPVALWPFDKSLFTKYAEEGRRFLVPEMNLGQYAELLRSAAGGDCVQSLTQVNGETISPATILAALEEAF